MRCHRPALFAFLAATLTGCASTYATGVGVPDPPLPLTDLPRPPSAGAAIPGLLRAEDLVEVEALTENRFVRSEKPGEIAVRLHLRAKTRKVDKRPPINLALVVDTSGSMEGPSIDHARAAALALVDALAEGDRLALVVYNSTAEVLLPSTVLTASSLADVRARIGAMKASGTTDLAGGLAAGLSEVQKSFQAAGINRIVVLGDGVPNDAAPLPGLAQAAGQQRIAVTMLGLGLDYDETLMSQLALASGGRYHYLKDSSQVAQVFADEVLHLKEVAGRGTVVTLTPRAGRGGEGGHRSPDAARGHADDRDPRRHERGGDRRDVVVRLTVAGRHARSVVELIDADVSADDLRTGRASASPSGRSSRSAPRPDAAQIAEGGNREVKQVIARLSVADAIVRAVAAVRGGDLALGRKLLGRRREGGQERRQGSRRRRPGREGQEHRPAAQVARLSRASSSRRRQSAGWGHGPAPPGGGRPQPGPRRRGDEEPVRRDAGDPGVLRAVFRRGPCLRARRRLRHGTM